MPETWVVSELKVDSYMSRNDAELSMVRHRGNALSLVVNLTGVSQTL
jgi:hypothetical protein